MNQFCRLDNVSQKDVSLLHLCVGCSDEQLAQIPAHKRHLVIESIRSIAEYVPTLFVVRPDQKLASLLEPCGAITKSKGARLVTAESDTLEAFAKLRAGSTVLITGIHASKEVFAAAADLMDFKGCKVALVREGISDTSEYGEKAAFAMLEQAYRDQIQAVRIDQCFDLAMVANDDAVIYEAVVDTVNTEQVRAVA